MSLNNFIEILYRDELKYFRVAEKTIKKCLIGVNPLHHFQKYKLAPKTFGFRHQGDPSGVPPNPPAKFEHKFAGGPGGPPRGPPDAEIRRFS